MIKTILIIITCAIGAGARGEIEIYKSGVSYKRVNGTSYMHPYVTIRSRAIAETYAQRPYVCLSILTKNRDTGTLDLLELGWYWEGARWEIERRGSGAPKEAIEQPICDYYDLRRHTLRGGTPNSGYKKPPEILAMRARIYIGRNLIDTWEDISSKCPYEDWESRL